MKQQCKALLTNLQYFPEVQVFVFCYYFVYFLFHSLSGGWFDLFSGVMSSAIDGKTSEENKVHDWMELTDKVPFDQ